MSRMDEIDSCMKGTMIFEYFVVSSPLNFDIATVPSLRSTMIPYTPGC